MKMLAAIHGATLTLLSFAAPTDASEPSLAGRWEGTAEIVVDWTSQRMLSVEIHIDSSGGVVGRVGDARIVDGLLRRNRGTFLRWLGWKTDYIVTGKLEGAIIQADSVARSGVRIPFNVVDERIEGGVHTTGSLTGGRESMKLSARRLVLRRVAGPSA